MPILLRAQGNSGNNASGKAAAHQAIPVVASTNLKWFTASRAGNGSTQLQWSSNKPLAKDAYVVERSLDGCQFVPLATLPASGTRYMYIDDTEDMGASVLYYRIRQQSGKKQPSASPALKATLLPRPLKMTAEETLPGQELQLNIFTQASSTGSLKIFNHLGEIIRQQSIRLNDGYNRMLLSGYQQLQPGNYYVTLETDQGLSSLKLER